MHTVQYTCTCMSGQFILYVQFCYLNRCSFVFQSQDFPRLSMLPHPENYSFEAKVMSGSDADLQELICGGWILQHYLDWPCPSEVSEWLFQVMCRHQDQHVISSSFQVLWVMVETATEVSSCLTVSYLKVS